MSRPKLLFVVAAAILVAVGLVAAGGLSGFSQRYDSAPYAVQK